MKEIRSEGRRMRSLSRRSVECIALAAVASGTLLAQRGPMLPQHAKPSPARTDSVIRVTTSRVLVDIVATDEKGNPVRGLKKEDFTLKEDGKPQRMLTFNEENGDKPDFVPPKLPALPANTFLDIPNGPERGPIYILVYDMLNTEPDDQGTTIKPMLDFIDSKPEGTRFAIFLISEGMHMLQGVTSDKTLLHAALTSKGPGPHIPNRFLLASTFGRYDPGYTLGVFHFLADYFEEIPGRKNLLWLAGFMPAQLYTGMNDVVTVDSDDVKLALNAMMRSQIAFYPIIVRGVVAFSDASWPLEQMNLDVLGSYTGGHAYYGNNDLKFLMNEAVKSGANYYSVSYSPTNDLFNGKARHISVAIEGKGYHLSYRQLYYAIPEGGLGASPKSDNADDQFLADKRSDSLYADIEHGAPMMHDLIFRVHLAASGEPDMATPEQMADIQDEPAYFRKPRKDKLEKPLPPVKLQNYVIDYTVVDAQLKTYAERTGNPATLEFVAVAYDIDGRMLNGISNEGEASPTANSEGMKVATFGAQQELLVPPGAASIRLAVRDESTRRTGTLEVPLPLKPEPAAQPAN